MPAAAIARSADLKNLSDIERIFALSESGLARLFRIERQSLVEWRRKGAIPVGRRASVERVAELARALQRELLPSRVPQIVRTKDSWLDNRSILETLAVHGPDNVYAYLHRLFSYGNA